MYFILNVFVIVNSKPLFIFNLSSIYLYFKEIFNSYPEGNQDFETIQPM